MPLHEDDPARTGNLSDEEYRERQEQRARTGDLHEIPEHYLTDAYRRLDADGE